MDNHLKAVWSRFDKAEKPVIVISINREVDFNSVNEDYTQFSAQRQKQIVQYLTELTVYNCKYSLNFVS